MFNSVELQPCLALVRARPHCLRQLRAAERKFSSSADRADRSPPHCATSACRPEQAKESVSALCVCMRVRACARMHGRSGFLQPHRPRSRAAADARACRIGRVWVCPRRILRSGLRHCLGQRCLCSGLAPGQQLALAGTMGVLAAINSPFRSSCLDGWYCCVYRCQALIAFCSSLALLALLAGVVLSGWGFCPVAVAIPFFFCSCCPGLRCCPCSPGSGCQVFIPLSVAVLLFSCASSSACAVPGGCGGCSATHSCASPSPTHTQQITMDPEQGLG